ncbi:MAG: RDD family protein, partial [Thiolinea sp.]
AAGYTGLTIGLGYFLFNDALPNGQSLGKKLLKIRTISNNTGNSCSIIQSFLRNITTPLGIFDWIFIFSRSRRRLGDLIASTAVITA